MNGRELFPKVIPQLDGVRGLAILLVLVSHAEGYRLIELGGWGKHGWLGVDLFFVLSGFLITGILADAKGKPHFFRNFYGRRVLRILPVYTAVIAASYLLMRGGVLPESAHAYPWLPYVLLVQNIAISTAGFHALGATWSLAIEEHFYLVWPWLVRKLESASLMHVLILIVVLSPLARWTGTYLGFSHFLMYKHTLLRLDGLAIGAMLALWIRSDRFSLVRLQRWAWGALAVGTPVSLWMLASGSSFAQIHNKTPISVMCAGMVGVALLASREGGALAKFFALRPLRFAGQISYCLYLVHIPILDIVTAAPMQQWLGGGRGVTLLFFLGGATGLATLSWYGFERPILRWKRRFAEKENSEPLKAASASV